MPTRMNKNTRPWLMFVTDGDGAGGGTTPPAAPADGTTPPAPAAGADGDLGFPKDTPIDQMTPVQQAAYWRNQSKTQQKEAEAFRKLGLTPEQIKKLQDDTETARLAALDETQRAIEEARNAGKAEAEATASVKFLRPAIEGQIMGLTRAPGESIEDATARVRGALEFADLTKFVGDNGDLDADKIQTFAKSIGPTDSNGAQPQSDPLYDALSRHQEPTPSSGSVDAWEKSTYDRLSTKQ